MLFYRVLTFFWLNNRLSLTAYILGSVSMVVFFFFRNRNLQADFNALSLLSILNITFFVFGLFLCRQILYKFYLNKSHTFFAQLPVSQIKMRLYEHLSFFILSAFPYLLSLPVLLFMVYYNGLWSSSQVLGFLGFEFILWLCFANYSLCIAMLGRLCWYLFWAILIGFNLYIRYSKNYDLDILAFLDVQQILYKKSPLTQIFIGKYLSLSILFYISAFFFSFTIDRNTFGILHAKENSLSRGLFILFFIVLIISNFYFVHQFNYSKSKFSGLYLTPLSNRADDFFSSSVQLDPHQLVNYQTNITRLNQDIVEFAQIHQLPLPPIHYQHNPDQQILVPLEKEIDSDTNLQISFNFEQLIDDFQNIERDIIIEYLKLQSRGWLEKENKLIYLRGLAVNWSWRNLEPGLIKKRLQFLTTYPNFKHQYKHAQWHSIFQNSGACLFDALAAHSVQELRQSTTAPRWHEFIKTGLNLDNAWLPFHLFRSVFQINSIGETILTKQFVLERPQQLQQTQLQPLLVNFSLKADEIYPQVFQLLLRTSIIENSHKAIQFHLYQHDTPGRKVDFQSMHNESFNPDQIDKNFIPQLLMLKNDKFSTTFSWYDAELDCRIYAPWSYVEL